LFETTAVWKVGVMVVLKRIWWEYYVAEPLAELLVDMTVD